MRKLRGLLVLAVVLLGCSPGADAGGKKEVSVSAQGDKKGVLVQFDSLSSRAPAEWQEEKIAAGLRFMQFRLPKVKDDTADAEVVIFKGIGGSTKDNIDRWKGMFKAPEGKSIDEVAKVTESKVGAVPVSTLDVSGIYMFKAQPFNPNAKAEPRPNWRMIGIVFDGKENVYHIRLVGPAATVENYRVGFEQWVKDFK